MGRSPKMASAQPTSRQEEVNDDPKLTVPKKTHGSYPETDPVMDRSSVHATEQISTDVERGSNHRRSACLSRIFSAEPIIKKSAPSVFPLAQDGNCFIMERSEARCRIVLSLSRNWLVLSPA